MAFDGAYGQGQSLGNFAVGQALTDPMNATRAGASDASEYTISAHLCRNVARGGSQVGSAGTDRWLISVAKSPLRDTAAVASKALTRRSTSETDRYADGWIRRVVGADNVGSARMPYRSQRRQV
jgi:hypothetical protein